MTHRGNAVSLQDQMAKLHQNMSFRDKRRAQQQEMRQSGADDPYDDRASKRVAGRGGASVGGSKDASSAARAAVASASALDGPNLMHCDVCSVSFAVQSQMMQHLAGPTHKKTVERAAAEERRLEQLGNNRWAAENAAASAGWQQNTRYTPAARQPAVATTGAEADKDISGRFVNSPAAAPTSDPLKPPATISGSALGGGGRLAGPPAFRPRKLTPEEKEGAAVADRARIAHAERVAAAQRTTAPLSIGGWVPPTVPSGDSASPAAAAVQGSNAIAAVKSEDDGDVSAVQAVIEVKKEDVEAQAAIARQSTSGSDSDSVSDSSSDGSQVPHQRPVSFF